MDVARDSKWWLGLLLRVENIYSVDKYFHGILAIVKIFMNGILEAISDVRRIKIHIGWLTSVVKFFQPSQTK